MAGTSPAMTTKKGVLGVAAGLNQFEEFLARFDQLKRKGGTPQRLVALVDRRKEMSDAVAALFEFLRRSDLERRLLYTSRKVFIQAPPAFDAAWADYKDRWLPALNYITLRGAGLEPANLDSLSDRGSDELEAPDPESEDSFDPSSHDGGAAVDLGIEQLEIEAQSEPIDDKTERAINAARIACGAYDYLLNTIGLDLRNVFARWRKVPLVFIPAHVSNRYGASDKGSLPHLLDDAVRAYVFGAPAAAFAMCRAAFEMILKQHYGEGKWEDPRGKLSKVVALASERGLVRQDEVRPLIDRADGILHRYAQEAVLSAEDERIILIFLATLKSLIENAPKP
jgi:hypothetical protein